MVAHRRLLVPARRHPDRRVLANRQATEGNVDSRPGRRALSRSRLTLSLLPRVRRWPLAQQPRTGKAKASDDHGTRQQGRALAHALNADAVSDRTDRLAHEEEERVQ